uniref:Uncharacterized protein n=1 Tax=Anguilla anguilla TaxID=7936 RepID=A0A0E9QDG9_ANGAN
MKYSILTFAQKCTQKKHNSWEVIPTDWTQRQKTNCV